MGKQPDRAYSPQQGVAWVVLAASLGGMITLIALLASWYVGQRNSYFTEGQQMTRCSLKSIAEVVEGYRSHTGKPPRSLSEIAHLAHGQQIHLTGISPEDENTVLDGWQHPFHYAVKGNDYIVFSYGRDNKPGGTGLDCDLTDQNPHPPEANMTWQQFAAQENSHPLIGMSLFCGFMTFGYCLYCVKPGELQIDHFLPSVVKYAVMFVGTLLMALVMAVLHQPSGH